MGKTVNMHEAKTNLSRLVQQIRAGEEREIIIAVSGKPQARLVPIEAAPKRVLGADRGLITIADDFDDVDLEIEKLFHGDL